MSSTYKSARSQKTNYSTVEYLYSMTAMISFNSFMVDEYGFVYKFINIYFNELLENGIKNVVLDITTNGGGVCTVFYSMLPYFTFLQVGGPNVFSSEYEYELGMVDNI